MSKHLNIVLGILIYLGISASSIYAADLDITCYEDQSPIIVRNTDPLFTITGFVPGETESKTIFVQNTDPTNQCRIFIRGTGNSTTLSNKIEVDIDGGIYNKTLTQFINDTDILIADLNPLENITRTMSLYFDETSGNSYANQNTSFDIILTSQWGDETEEEEGDIQGTTDTQNPSVFYSIAEALGIGGPDESTNEEETKGEDNESSEEVVLGEESDDIRQCKEKTLWWIPIIVQITLTLLILLYNKDFFKEIPNKLLLSFLIGIAAFFAINWIGCGCNPVWLCTYHWITNLVISIVPLLALFNKQGQEELI